MLTMSGLHIIPANALFAPRYFEIALPCRNRQIPPRPLLTVLPALRLIEVALANRTRNVTGAPAGSWFKLHRRFQAGTLSPELQGAK